MKLRHKWSIAATAATALLAATLTASPAFAYDRVKFASKGSKDCLDANNGRTVLTIKCNEEAGLPEDGWQVWELDDVGNGMVIIRNELYNTCLDGEYSQLSLQTCRGDNGAQWWYTDDANHLRCYGNARRMLYDVRGSTRVGFTDNNESDSYTQWRQYPWRQY